MKEIKTRCMGCNTEMYIESVDDINICDKCNSPRFQLLMWGIREGSERISAATDIGVCAVFDILVDSIDDEHTKKLAIYHKPFYIQRWITQCLRLSTEQS